ncbi:MAG: hypothetical protein ACRD28_09140 [Acidobacteriaceae bacterium]
MDLTLDQADPNAFRNAGGKWMDEMVTNDRNWVSSRQPADIPAFNDAIIQLFAASRQKAQRAS